jgi:hypothetical protein
MSDKPKKDILSIQYCDILTDECPTPELSCYNCPVLKNDRK